MTESEIQIRIAFVAAAVWLLLVVVFGFTRLWRHLISAIVAPLFLLCIWIPHLWAASGFFSRMTSIWNPTVSEITSATLVWGVVAPAFYAIVYHISCNQQWWPGGKKLGQVFIVVFMCHFVAALTINLLGTSRAFGLLTVFDLHSYSLLIHARPGFGSGGYIAGATMGFFPIIGGTLYAVYAILIELVITIVLPNTKETAE